MSSLAAVQADSLYHPPDWDPRKESRRSFTKSKGSNQYEQYGLVRFEMPFDVWCVNCSEATEAQVANGTACSSGQEQHIGRGVRYDARKVRIGKYHSTTIWQFEMRCHLCHGQIIIRTDPQNCDYECVAGIRRKCKGGYSAASAGVIELSNIETRQHAARDPLFALEHAQQDKRRAKRKRQDLEALLEVQARGRVDYALNQRARAHFRSADDALQSLSTGTGRDGHDQGDDSNDCSQLHAARRAFAKRDAVRARSAHAAKSRLIVAQGAFGATLESDAARTAFARGIQSKHFKMPQPRATAAEKHSDGPKASSGSISASIPTFSIRKKQ
eukprot:g1925.t1